MHGTYLFPRVPDGLLEQVDEIGRAELAQRGKRICAGINRLGQDLLVDPVAPTLAEVQDAGCWGGARTREQLAQPLRQPHPDPKGMASRISRRRSCRRCQAVGTAVREGWCLAMAVRSEW